MPQRGQVAVSRSLARLEAEVGAVLVDRHTRHLRLSDAGRLFLPHARRILSDVDEAGAVLEGLTGTPRGTLRINAAVTFALGLVAPMLPAFMRRYPALRVVLETENRVVDLAREEVDVAIRVGQLADSDLMARKLGSIELWPCTGPAGGARHPARARRPRRAHVAGVDRSAQRVGVHRSGGGGASGGGAGRGGGARAGGAANPGGRGRRDRSVARLPGATAGGQRRIGPPATGVPARACRRARRLSGASEPVGQGAGLRGRAAAHLAAAPNARTE